MPIRSFQAKLLYLMVAVLILLQAATLVAVHVAGRRTMFSSIDDELRVGTNILDQILERQGEQLSQTVRVLASDFAFREAIALGEGPTITSALSNHAARIEADAAFVISLDGSVIADTLGGRVGHRFPHSVLVSEAQTRGESSGIVSLDGRPYQLAIVPILGPQPIAWVCMGFEIDATMLNEVQRLTGLDLSLSNAAAGARVLSISTLPRDKIGSPAYRSLSHPLTTADNSRINTLLQRSIEDAAGPYRQLELQIAVLSTMALIAALIAASLFARGVSRPLEQL